MAFLRSSTARASELAAHEALRVPGRDGWRLLAATLSVLTLVWSRDLPAAEGSRAASIKAAFIFNFVQFTEWPDEAFADQEAPLVIGVLGSNPFGDVLETTVTNEVVRGRRLVVEHYNRVAEIKTCHILYIGQSEGNRLERITEALKGKPVLTVSDIENSAAHRVIIELMTSQNRIRFRINLEAAKAANLSLSSKLLRAGEIAKQ